MGAKNSSAKNLNEATKTIRLLVVDDHALVRQGIMRILNSEKWIDLVGEASNGFEALAKVRELQPDVVLMDLYMPGMDGVTAIRLIKQEVPDVKIVLLSMSTEEKDIVEGVQSGARGYICKSGDAAGMVRQLKSVVSGGVAMSEEMTAKLVAGLAHNSSAVGRSAVSQYNSVSQREKDVLVLISKGASNKQISSSLFVSEHTVRAHVRSLMQKLGADNRTQLAVYGVQQGFGVDGRGSRNGQNGHSELSHSLAS